MKCRRLVPLLLLVCAFTGCLLLKSDERIDVVAAATDLSAGKKLSDKDITIVSIPVSRMTRDMPRKNSQVIGHTTKVPISKGELLLLSEMN